MNAGKQPLHPRLRECALPVAVASILAALLAASIPLANMSVPNWVYPSNPFNIPNIAFAWLAVFFGMWLLTAENAPHRFAGILRRAYSRTVRKGAPKPRKTAAGHAFPFPGHALGFRSPGIDAPFLSACC